MKSEFSALPYLPAQKKHNCYAHRKEREENKNFSPKWLGRNPRKTPFLTGQKAGFPEKRQGWREEAE